jgi:septal ring factor EnvC (AmiA/AmiB activator)
MTPSVIFNVCGLAVIVAAIVFIFRNPTLPGAGATGIMALMAFACLFIGNLDRIETFKASASGIEAKTREVQQVIDSAKATVSSLNELAKAIAAIEVDLIAGAARIGADSKHKDALKSDLLQKLKALGLDENSLKEVASADRSYVTFDYAIALLQELTHQSVI